MVGFVNNYEVELEADFQQDFLEFLAPKSFQRGHTHKAWPACRVEFAPDIANVGGSNVGKVEPESLVHFTTPLLAQVGGAYNENALHIPSGNKLLQDQPGLDRLSQSHFVGNQHSVRQRLDEFENWLKLVTEKLGSRCS